MCGEERVCEHGNGYRETRGNQAFTAVVAKDRRYLLKMSKK
jgi:hypothetical protein